MCLDEEGEFSNGQTLNQQDCKPYFDFILSNQLLKAAEARKHASTMCFNETYFEPLNIYSLLDFIFHLDFEPTGVICCESVGKCEHWTEEDEENLKRISGITSMFFSKDIRELGSSAEEIIKALDE